MSKLHEVERNKDPRFQFFPAQKRELLFDGWSPKRNKENEKRVLLEFSMPLTGQKLIGFPAFLQDAYEALEKEESPVTELTLSTELEGMTVEFYDTEGSAERCQLIAAATLRSFKLIRIPDKDSFVTAVTFSTTVLRNKGLLLWCDRYEGMKLWADFVPTQMKIEAPTWQMKLEDDPRQSPEAAADVREVTQKELDSTNGRGKPGRRRKGQ